MKTELVSVEWHEYPAEPPKFFGHYLITIKTKTGLDVVLSKYLSNNTFPDEKWCDVIAWADIPHPAPFKKDAE